MWLLTRGLYSSENNGSHFDFKLLEFNAITLLWMLWYNFLEFSFIYVPWILKYLSLTQFSNTFCFAFGFWLNAILQMLTFVISPTQGMPSWSNRTLLETLKSFTFMKFANAEIYSYILLCPCTCSIYYLIYYILYIILS